MATKLLSEHIAALQNANKEYSNAISKAPSNVIVELCFMNLFRADCKRVQWGGTGKLHVNSYGRKQTYNHCEQLTITGDDSSDGPTGETLRFCYLDQRERNDGRNCGLIILDANDNIVYWRETGQKPRTEWLVNILADDFEDENGNFVFAGEPVTI